MYDVFIFLLLSVNGNNEQIFFFFDLCNNGINSLNGIYELVITIQVIIYL